MLPIDAHNYGQAQEGVAGYHKRPQPAAVLELPFAPAVVTAALNYLSKKSKSGTLDLKGFTTFRNPEPAPNHYLNADLYFKVRRKSRQEKEISTVSLLLTIPEKGMETANNLYYINMEQAKSYLNDLVPAIHAYQLDLQIKDQNDAIAKAESKYKRLAGDGEELEKKRMGIEKKIRDNKLEKEIQLNKVDKQKLKLAESAGQQNYY